MHRRPIPRPLRRISGLSLSPDDLAKLNDGEALVLQLLSAGHTIKTAAAELGLTENAVNERLRSARRKTGAQSSRDLARALFASDPQISCDNLSVVPDDVGLVDEGPRRSPIPAGWLTTKGLLIMSILALGTAALVALTQFSGGEPQPVVDEGLPPLAEPGMALREKLESETSDPAWALATQKELGSRFLDRDGVEMVAARCRTSLCEINAYVRENDRREAIRSIGDRAFLESFSDLGLGKVETIDMRFAESEEPGSITVFLARE